MKSKQFKYKNYRYKLEHYSSSYHPKIIIRIYSSWLSACVNSSDIYKFIDIKGEDVEGTVMEAHKLATAIIDLSLKPKEFSARVKKAINSDQLRKVQEIVQ